MIRFLTAGPEDWSFWLDMWRLSGCEPFAHPSFLELTARPESEAAAIVWGSDSAPTVLLPLEIRELPVDLISQHPEASGWRDAISPYGYGGPFTTGGFVDWAQFWRDLRSLMREKRILTLFVRAAIGATDALPEEPGCDAVRLSENIVVDLGRTAEAQWMHYDHKVRKNVNKARRAGLRVEIDTDFRTAGTFAEVYLDTMDRRDASSWFRFDEQFFARLGEALKGSYFVASVLDGNHDVVSVELALHSQTAIYSFLGGTRREFFGYSPNDLLKAELIDFANRSGFTTYVLGGGYEGNDGIFRYKRSFDRDGVVPFYGIRVTSDAELYARLCKSYNQGARASGRGVGAIQGYFPEYRAPLRPSLPDVDEH